MKRNISAFTPYHPVLYILIIFYFIILLPHHRYIVHGTYINMTRAIWVDKYFNKTCQLSVCWMPGSDAVIHQNFSGNLKASLLVSNLALGNVWSPQMQIKWDKMYIRTVLFIWPLLQHLSLLKQQQYWHSLHTERTEETYIYPTLISPVHYSSV